MSCSEWKEYKLDELYTVTNGLSKKRDEFGFGYEFLSFTEVFNNYFVPKKLNNLANTSEKEREKCSIKRGDVFLTRTSETLDELGKSCVALKDFPNATFNGFTKRLRPKGNVEILPEYAGYFFRSNKFKNAVTSMSSMTTRASLNNDMLSVLSITVPPIEEQEKIANILLSLDNKIELNNEMNKTLEEIAQSIFKRWFVDFEFPNEDGQPYKSSGGEMVESELGMIPKGWEVKELGSICEVKGGKRLPKGMSVVDYKTLYPYLRVTDVTNGYVNMNSIKYIDEQTHEKISRYIIEYNDLYISIAGTIGLVGGINKKLDKANLTENMARIICKNINKNYIRLYLNSEEIQNIIKSKAVGSTQPKLPLYVVKGIQILIPKKSLLDEFINIVDYIYLSTEKNLINNDILEEIRDNLLEKLLSGKIEIK